MTISSLTRNLGRTVMSGTLSQLSHSQLSATAVRHFSTASSTGQDHTPPKLSISGHFVKSPPSQAPLAIPFSNTKTLTSMRFGMIHQNQQEFETRNEAYEHYLPAEISLLNGINQRMQKDHQPGAGEMSAETMLSADMVHAQRGSFSSSETLRNATVGKASPETASLIEMFQEQKQGPLTLSQSQLGAEVAVTTNFMRSKDEQKEVKERRIDAGRAKDETGQVSHQTKSKYGMELDDIGTQVRDKLGLPIMSGTSGTSSTMVLSHLQATGGQPLTAEQIKTMANLGFQYMRTGAVPEAVKTGIEQNMSRQHPDSVLEPPEVPLERVQTHTYAEVYSAVKMSAQGSNANSLEAHEAANQEAKGILDQQLRTSKL